MLELYEERRLPFTVAHLILKRVLCLKTGTKICFSDGKAEQYWCFALRSAWISSPVRLSIFPDSLWRRTKTAQQTYSSQTLHLSCLPWKQKHLGRMVQPVLTIALPWNYANTHTQPWKPGSAPGFCSSDIALDASRYPAELSALLLTKNGTA